MVRVHPGQDQLRALRSPAGSTDDSHFWQPRAGVQAGVHSRQHLLILRGWGRLCWDITPDALGRDQTSFLC